MKYENIVFFFTLLSWTPHAFSFENQANDIWIQFNGKHISLKLPISKYRNVVESLRDEKSTSSSTLDIKNTPIRIDFSLINKRPLGGTSSDIGSICNSSIIACAAGTGIKNYWIDQATQNIKLGEPTSPVYSRRLGAWQAYEAFPLCGWTSTSGVYSPYGGQCYAAVLTIENKTVDFQILLGQNRGCKKIETCWAYSLDRIRKMMASVDR